jgi:transcriptional regulator with XRE-family HTH domain
LDSIKEVFASNLRRLRAHRTQAEMAELLKLPLRTYQRLEAAERFPREGTIKRITAKCGASEVDLFQAPGFRPPQTPEALLAKVADALGLNLPHPKPHTAPASQTNIGQEASLLQPPDPAADLIRFLTQAAPDDPKLEAILSAAQTVLRAELGQDEQTQSRGRDQRKK